jgi:hypothetical protein
MEHCSDCIESAREEFEPKRDEKQYKRTTRSQVKHKICFCAPLARKPFRPFDYRGQHSGDVTEYIRVTSAILIAFHYHDSRRLIR